MNVKDPKALPFGPGRLGPADDERTFEAAAVQLFPEHFMFGLEVGGYEGPRGIGGKEGGADFVRALIEVLDAADLGDIRRAGSLGVPRRRSASRRVHR